MHRTRVRVGLACVCAAMTVLWAQEGWTDGQRLDQAEALLQSLQGRVAKDGQRTLNQILSRVTTLRGQLLDPSYVQQPAPEPTPDPDPTPDPNPDPNPTPTPGGEGNDYYNTLVTRNDLHAAYSLRTQAEIDRYKFGQLTYVVRVNYDASADAAKWSWGTNDLNAEQIRLPLVLTRPASGSSKLFIVSDHWWDEGWLTEWWYDDNGTYTRLEGWKWLQVTDNYVDPTRTKQEKWFEPNMRWIGWDAPILSWFGARGYAAVNPPTVRGGDSVRICGKNFMSDSIGPMLNCFKAYANTWTRVFLEVEQRAGNDFAKISFWMADENQDPMPIILDAEMWSGGVNLMFWIEYNTSRPNRIGGPMAAYARNVVMLQDVADPTPLLLRPVR